MGGSADLKEFTGLKTFNAYNNQFESLEFLNSLSNKQHLKKINFYGNQLKEVDFATLLKEFPNLEWLNIENNPVKATNLQKLTKEQINSLCEKIKERKFKVNSYKGTVLIDLLFHIQSLIKQGDSSQTRNAQRLEKIIQMEKSAENSTNKPASPRAVKGLIMTLAGGVMVILAVGIWLGQWWSTKKQKWAKAEKEKSRKEKKLGMKKNKKVLGKKTPQKKNHNKLTKKTLRYKNIKLLLN